MKRILIIKPSSMGDVLHAFPAVHALMASDSGLAVDWVINPAFAELLDYLPGIRRKILFRRRELGRFSSFFSAGLELLRELRREKYDAVIDLQGLFRSALVGIFARGGLLYGPAEAREKAARLCYRRKLRYPENTSHAIEKNCAMIRDFSGLEKISCHYPLPEVEKYSESAQRLLAEKGLQGKKRIAIAPGARWETKQWPPEFFAAAAVRIAARLPEYEFVLLGSPAEKELCVRVMEAAETIWITDLSGQTMPGALVEVIRHSELLICNDSGPMHIAAAAGTPVVALFGPTDPALTGPYGPQCRVIQPELDCLGCLSKSCPTERCHSAVEPERLAENAFQLLKQGVGNK